MRMRWFAGKEKARGDQNNEPCRYADVQTVVRRLGEK
jgi:hypothetical protein